MLYISALLLLSVSLYGLSNAFRLGNKHILSHRIQNRMSHNVMKPTMSTGSGSSAVDSKDKFLYKLGAESSLGMFQIDDCMPKGNVVKALLSLAVKPTSDERISSPLGLTIYQKTNGPIPRSYLPSILALQGGNSEIADGDTVASIMEEGIRWFLDGGGRPSQLIIAVSSQLVSDHVESMGFDPIDASSINSEITALLTDSAVAYDHGLYRCNTAKYWDFCKSRQEQGRGNAFTLFEIEGRLMHDMNRPMDSIKPYTQALQLNPKSAATFRNLGSAYHATGSLQMAFASFQQAVQLDAKDPLVYLKLAFFYEDFASKDWVDAEVHAQRCYEYYLTNVDAEDTAILARLGNLLVKEHKPAEALQAYDRILAIDQTMYTAWFNKAHAQLKLGDHEGAAVSLRKTLDLKPTMSAASHMLVALVEEEASKATTMDAEYIIDLFDTYASTFDSHGKKLLYSAPRVIRQELATVYRSRFGTDGDLVARFGPLLSIEDKKKVEVDAVPLSSAPDCVTGVDTDSVSYTEASTLVADSCSSYTSFMNRSLDILDIGCGTGLAGAWLKDYAQHLVGVDISPEMVQKARKKGLYDTLHVASIAAFFESVEGKATEKMFDVVVAADVFSYVGDLSSTFMSAFNALRNQGLMVFTVESIEDTAYEKGYILTKSGRFKYSKKYLDNLINSELGEVGGGVTVLMDREYSHQLDAGYAIPGFLYIVQKN
jgi:predicted TPR repeat methyltransferase